MNRFRWWTLLAVVLVAGGGALVYVQWFRGDRQPQDEKPLPEEQVTIYLLNQDEYQLEAVQRTVPEASDHSARIQQIVEELTASSEQDNLVRLVPEGLSLRSSYLDGQTVYLDFNDALVGAANGTSGEMMLLYSIVNSVLKNLPEKYKLVQFLIEGEMRKTIGPYGEESGHIAVQYPLGPRWNLADTS